MARSISEQELQLKKRARRRLVGAIVLVTAVAVVLPMVLDSEPKPVRQNVDIHIPSPEAGDFKAKPSEATEQAAAPIKGLPEAPAVAPTAETAGGSSNAAGTQAARESPPKVEAPASRLSGMSDGVAGAPGKDQPDSVKPSTPSPNAEASAPPRTVAGERPESPRSASSASRSKPETDARSGRTESARAPAPPAKRPADAPSDSGNYVVQVAALADPAKARQLQKQMSGAGLKTYTEVVLTRTGEVTRVRAGPYATREAAEKARAQLKKAGLEGQVVAK